MSTEGYETAQERIRACRERGDSGLDLRKLGLTTLPPEITQLTALTSLNLSRNTLTTLPPEIGRLTALTSLDLWDNRLTALPPEIGHLTALRFLFLECNTLTTLPPEIGHLTALSALHLAFNNLETLPPEIGRLTALTHLYLADNTLATLPPEIGHLPALTTLYIMENRLTTLPRSLLDRAGSDLTLKALGNPLREPPLRVVEQGPAAIGRYLALADKGRRGGWVAVGSRLTRHFGLHSRLAAAETLGMTGLVTWAAHLGMATLVWSAVALAPLLLLKTRASVTLGTRRFAWLMGVLGLKRDREGVSRVSLPGRVLLLGLGSVGIKMVTTPYTLWRHPKAAMKAMPGNLREQCLEIDVTCAPELVPGLERAYDRRPQAAFLFNDLTRPYHKRAGGFDYFVGDWKRPTRATLASAPFLAVFFAVATLYRLYVKAAAIFYLPLLLLDVPDRARLTRRTAPDGPAPGRGGRGTVRTQTAVLALAFGGLATLAGYPAVEAGVVGWVDAHLIKVSMIASVADHLPKAVLSLLFFQAGVFLIGAGAERWARGPQVGAAGPDLPPVAARWIGIAQGFYMGHAVLIVLLVVATYLAVAPNIFPVIGDAYRFFF